MAEIPVARTRRTAFNRPVASVASRGKPTSRPWPLLDPEVNGYGRHPHRRLLAPGKEMT
jgi:hypothetical protein